MTDGKRLQGTVLEVARTGDTKSDDENRKWTRCIFTIELTGFSKRTPNESLPPALEKKTVKLERWCCYDWHYNTGIRTTLDPEETRRILEDNSI
jgi:hypothetical protein